MCRFLCVISVAIICRMVMPSAICRPAVRHMSPRRAPINYITLDSVQIEAGVSLNAPDSVQAIQIAPAEQGVLKATLQFNAPSKTLGGETLSSLTGVKIFRDDQLVTTVPAQPGQAVTYQDETPSNGFNTYKLVAVNADGDGVVNSATKYIGMDVPDVSSLNAILSDPSADKYN